MNARRPSEQSRDQHAYVHKVCWITYKAIVRNNWTGIPLTEIVKFWELKQQLDSITENQWKSNYFSKRVTFTLLSFSFNENTI